MIEVFQNKNVGGNFEKAFRKACNVISQKMKHFPMKQKYLKQKSKSSFEINFKGFFH